MPPTTVNMMWITAKLDQMVRFPGNIFDIRKRMMIPSSFLWAKEDPPPKRGMNSVGLLVNERKRNLPYLPTRKNHQKLLNSRTLLMNRP